MNAQKVESQILILLQTISEIATCQIEVCPHRVYIKVINDTPLAIFPEPSRYEFGEISEDLATSLIEANLKQSDAIKIASCLFLLKEQYENFLHQKEYMVDLHDLVSFTNYNQGVEL